MKTDQSAFLNHILDAIKKIEKYIQGIGEEAFNILNKEPIDLLLMDYNMPKMSGGTALSQIRQDRILRDMPVIMITAQAFQDYVAEAAESYVDALILKPLNVKILQQKVAHGIRQQQR